VGESGGINQCFAICGGKRDIGFDFGHAEQKEEQELM